MKPLLPMLALAFSLSAFCAQQAIAPAPYVFHAYSSVVEIPVLTLTPNQKILPPSTPLHFDVSIDGGPPFPIHHVRLEGGDPISLSIVLDLSGSQKHLIRDLDQTTVDKTAVDETIENWVRQSLRPIDRISVYAVDCTLLQTATNMPAAGTTLTHAINTAVHSTSIHQGNQNPSSCISNTAAFTDVINQMSSQRGRRVILAVGRGRMKKTITTADDIARGAEWRVLTALANTASVAIFGLEESNSYPASYKDIEDPFNLLCQRSGGLLLNTNPEDAEQALQHFIALVRDRYIVEFPRPDSLASGLHLLGVTIADTTASYFIRPSGISVPVVDPAILNDPTTLSSDPSNAPKPGSRRLLTLPH